MCNSDDEHVVIALAPDLADKADIPDPQLPEVLQIAAIWLQTLPWILQFKKKIERLLDAPLIGCPQLPEFLDSGGMPFNPQARVPSTPVHSVRA